MSQNPEITISGAGAQFIYVSVSKIGHPFHSAQLIFKSRAFKPRLFPLLKTSQLEINCWAKNGNQIESQGSNLTVRNMFQVLNCLLDIYLTAKSGTNVKNRFSIYDVLPQGSTTSLIFSVFAKKVQNLFQSNLEGDETVISKQFRLELASSSSSMIFCHKRLTDITECVAR